ncbi:hypothetical protein EJ06DRAFT_314881 [Trichodelitschia bisporula]|uniref:Chromatin assembly factor 1 subunit A n=1 Tax=Trichodelitschia bisporula TaxID=703511 RepID=A0A6G1I3T9_9PEZI|nr:hypothetical protein EJ06DRAFT_314881 [Trichodelitschia bisporula]
MADDVPMSSTPSTPRKRSLADANGEGAGDDVDSVLSSSVLTSPKSIADPNSLSQPSQTLPNRPAGSYANPAPAKRRKLTIAEKQQLEAEKEAKVKEKAESKAKREEEQRVKDEEKRRRAEEREEKRKAKEFEKQKKEEEQRKKERSQLRLSSFFASKPADASPAKPALKEGTTATSSKPRTTASPMKVNPKDAQVREYNRYFLPFCLPQHTILAPINPQLPPKEELERICSELDKFSGDKQEPMAVHHYFPKGPRRGRVDPPVRRLVDKIQGLSSSSPIDLTNSTYDPLATLFCIPMKYLHFCEDVRPPYVGTCTKCQDVDKLRKAARNPNHRIMEGVNYEYDSEAEWEEPEEGEDLASEGEEEEEDEPGDEDMEDFVDDEGAVDAAKHRRGIITTDLLPVSTGLCWEDEKGVSRNAETGETVDLDEYKIVFLLDSSVTSVDPHSTKYWDSESATAAAPTNPGSAATKTRFPLQTRLNGSSPLDKPVPPVGAKAAGTGPKALATLATTKRMVPAEDLAAFKEAIDGSDMTKIALIEDLKRKFPKITKDAIVNTLGAVAVRVGSRAAEKKWKLLDDGPV